MFPGHKRETSAAAFHLLALLEQYEEDTAALAAGHWSAPAYARWTQAFEDMRLVALTVPDLHVPWLHLLINRTDIVHATWLLAQGRPSEPSLRELQAPHQEAIAALRQRAMRLIRSNAAA